MTGDICSVSQVDWLSEFRVGLWRVTIGYIGACGADDYAAIWRKRMTSLNLADIGRKYGRKYMNLADHVRRFVRKWLEGRRRGRDGGIVLGAKAPAHSLSPRRRGPCKALIHSGRQKAALLFSVPPPYESELSTGS